MRSTHCKYLNEVRVKRKGLRGCTCCLQYWNLVLTCFFLRMMSCNSAYRLRYWNNQITAPSTIASINQLQQHLLFTVLKLNICFQFIWMKNIVATVLTVYGIETPPRIFHPYNGYKRCNSTYRLRYWNLKYKLINCSRCSVATVLTVYGIETPVNMLLKLDF